ncbi:MAG: DNA-3-methyladenine glycosylase I [Deltaproteobacteria bacterium]|nr:DNA-3-methyladenine glycosylase I [Deltaproteobacteria bacterium]
MRCPWALISSRMAAYHDLEWGIPSRDDRHIFKMLILEGMQAGLSWAVILRKSEFLEEAFDGFDPEKIAGYKSDKVEKLMSNPDIIRNKLKINAVISNAAAYLKLRREEGSLSDFLWKFVDDKPIINNWKVMSEVPSKTTLSDKISQELKKRGFKFVGSTIVYSLMQSIGLVNDHLKECSFRFKKPNPLPVLEGKTAPAK